jgi:hypothetical protein
VNDTRSFDDSALATLGHPSRHNDVAQDRLGHAGTGDLA